MLILASGSPRRKELLKKLVQDYTVIVPNVDESLYHVQGKDLPAEESRIKAYAIASKYPNEEVIACDTVVLLDGEVLGKPNSKEAAFRMLKEESGKKQVVLSGYTYIGKGKEITRTVSTEVYFNNLTDGQINEYIEKFLPLDKAGAYGIQDAYPLIREIRGSYYNVMGLPVEDMAEHLPICQK